MVGNFVMPPVGYGPGSQPTEEDGESLEYMPMPQDMRSYTAHIPDVAAEGVALQPALDLLRDLSAACTAVAQGQPHRQFDLSGLDAANRGLIAETLGQGEVSVRIHGIPAIAAQESVFAGVWVLRASGIDMVEVAPVPSLALERAFEPRRWPQGQGTQKQPGVVNAPSILTELEDKSTSHDLSGDPHVVNLTLLPHTEEDLDWLALALGEGAVDILSRGYGNCRVTATALANVWRVQFFNSMDTLILDTFEVTRMPEVTLAATEDLTDSAERILEVLEAIA